MRLTLVNNTILSCIYGVIVFGISACGKSGDAGNVQQDFELTGSWASNYGTYALGTNDSWEATTIVEFDNEANIAITQNAADAAYNPSQFGKIIWTEPTDEGFWLCTLEFGKDTAAEARAGTTVADSTDPAAGGCGGFSWTHFFTPLEIEGMWASDDDETTNTISSVLFAEQTLVTFSNDGNFAITQNASDAESNPGKFNRIVWTELSAGTLYLCVVDEGLATKADALNSTEVYDAADLNGEGCSGAPWTKLRTAIELSGEWTGPFGEEEINSFEWNGNAVIEFNNDENFAITQNAADAEYGPSTFNKIVWTELKDNSFWYCTIDFGQTTAEDARNSTKVVDATDPATAGCGGFAWTSLSVPSS